MTEFDAIEDLAKCYGDNCLQLSPIDDENLPHEYSLKAIRFAQNQENCTEPVILPVFDEFDDTAINNPVLWLHLLIDTCEGFEESQDYTEWRLNEGYPDTSFFKSLYASYKEKVPKLRKIIGTDIKAINAHHLEFNTNVAQALRAYQFDE